MSKTHHSSPMGALAWLRHRGSIVLDRLGITENTFMVMLALAIGILARLGNYVFCQPPQHSLS